uniref:Transmembrane protein 82 n=1 Tax=Salmo trutta TaxID=8032 RepID=A0A673ZCC9_SALTR
MFTVSSYSLLSSNNEGSSKETSMQKTPRHQASTKIGQSEALQFLLLLVMQAVVGSRVASLVVLEFSLRTMSAWVTAGPQLLVQCQFSLGCALSCGLSWFLASQTGRLRLHVMALYRLHSSQRYCGVCMTLLTSGCSLLPRLTRALMLTFPVAAIAALRFWTPLTICYTLMVVYMQAKWPRCFKQRGVGLMVLMLIVGRWADVVLIILCFLGEASCLIPSRDLLDATTQVRMSVPQLTVLFQLAVRLSIYLNISVISMYLT